MTILLCLIFVLAGPWGGGLGADELVRFSVDESREGRGLYRIADGEAGSELEILRTAEGEWKPAVIILDTPRYQAGSLSPSGLWRFCGMESLLSEDELSRDTGLKAERSDSSLERPGVAVRIPGRGGGLFKQEENRRLCALWGSVEPSPYLSLEVGEAFLFPEEDREDDSWFPGDDRDSDEAVSITACDLRWERRDSAFRLRAGTAFSRYRKPAYSLLPGWRFYLGAGEFSSRIWYPSDSWTGSSLEEPDWLWLWDNSLVLRLPARIVLKGGASGGAERAGGFGGECGFSAEFSPGILELKLDCGFKGSRAEESRIHDYGGRIHLYHGDWRESLSGDLCFDEKKLTGWSVEPGIRRSPRSGRYDKLSCLCRGEPGRLIVTPSAGCSLPIGKISIRIALSYEFLYAKEPISPDEDDPLSFRITGEWSGR